MMKLEEMDYQLNNVNSISERLIIMNMTEDISKDVINDGRWILEKAPEAQVSGKNEVYWTYVSHVWFGKMMSLMCLQNSGGFKFLNLFLFLFFK